MTLLRDFTVLDGYFYVFAFENKKSFEIIVLDGEWYI